ncbi:hypothetical protein H2200_013037 [Cladophialophora chaetospira]|uniref:Cytochrome P450 n=1 Tax=Cladophialophora chaetospira TaxID=386627 RepID=A0AA39CBQ7_9EURO|nr:hypothetical protein H2200_013037 [Cladophialophora chaetospira]
MLSVSTAVLVVGVFIFGLYRLLIRASIHRQPEGTKELPGPKGFPIVGNLLQLPPHHTWLKFKEWADQYGPIYKISLAGTDHVIISSEKIANDLMRERGSLYSDRDQAPMAAKLLSDDFRPLFLPYGETWREFRKFAHQMTMPSAAVTYEPMQEEESLRVVHDLIRTPADYERIFNRYAASVIMRLAFGITLFTGEEEAAQRILKVDHELERVASPGAYLVDMFPSMMYLPDFLAPFKREGKRLHAEELDLFRSLVTDVDRRRQAGDPSVNNTFTLRWLESKDDYKLSDDHAAYVLGTLFEAAAGTTSNSMMSLMLAITLHPDKYHKLQEEIDRHVPSSRLPSFADMPNLPYLRAFVKENLRWRPVTAGGLPHKLTARDDVYNGYSIRKNTIIHPVQWSIHRDTSLYPDPESFIPERWLEASYPTYKEPLTVYPNLQNYSNFGFGRRICVGQNVAERSLYIEAAMLAWACDIKEIPGKKPPEYDYITGFNTRPKWFDFELKARRGREEVVKRVFEKTWGDRVMK